MTNIYILFCIVFSAIVSTLYLRYKKKTTGSIKKRINENVCWHAKPYTFQFIK